MEESRLGFSLFQADSAQSPLYTLRIPYFTSTSPHKTSMTTSADLESTSYVSLDLSVPSWWLPVAHEIAFAGDAAELTEVKATEARAAKNDSDCDECFLVLGGSVVDGDRRQAVPVTRLELLNERLQTIERRAGALDELLVAIRRLAENLKASRGSGGSEKGGEDKKEDNGGGGKGRRSGSAGEDDCEGNGEDLEMEVDSDGGFDGADDNDDDDYSYGDSGDEDAMEEDEEDGDDDDTLYGYDAFLEEDDGITGAKEDGEEGSDWEWGVGRFHSVSSAPSSSGDSATGADGLSLIEAEALQAQAACHAAFSAVRRGKKSRPSPRGDQDEPWQQGAGEAEEQEEAERVLRWCSVRSMGKRGFVRCQMEVGGVVSNVRALAALGLSTTSPIVITLYFTDHAWRLRASHPHQQQQHHHAQHHHQRQQQSGGEEATSFPEPSRVVVSQPAAEAGEGGEPGSSKGEQRRQRRQVLMRVLLEQCVGHTRSISKESLVTPVSAATDAADAAIASNNSDSGKGGSAGNAGVLSGMSEAAMRATLKRLGGSDPAKTEAAASGASHSSASTRVGEGWSVQQALEARVLQVVEQADERVGQEAACRVGVDSLVPAAVTSFFKDRHSHGGETGAEARGKKGGLGNAFVGLLVHVARQLQAVCERCVICGQALALKTQRVRPCTDDFCLYRFEELGLASDILSELRSLPLAVHLDTLPPLAALQQCESEWELKVLLAACWIIRSAAVRKALEAEEAEKAKVEKEAEEEGARVKADSVAAGLAGAGAAGEGEGGTGASEAGAGAGAVGRGEKAAAVVPAARKAAAAEPAAGKAAAKGGDGGMSGEQRVLADVLLPYRVLRFVVSTSRLTLLKLDGTPATTNQPPQQQQQQQQRSQGAKHQSKRKQQQEQQHSESIPSSLDERSSPATWGEGGEWACAGLPLSACHQLAVFADGCPKQAQFERLRQSKGSFFAFHGSSTFNWFSILRNGLRSMSNTGYMSTGAAYGSGIYLSPHFETSYGYSGRGYAEGNGGVCCVAICEVVHSPAARGRPYESIAPGHGKTMEERMYDEETLVDEGNGVGKDSPAEGDTGMNVDVTAGAGGAAAASSVGGAGSAAAAAAAAAPSTAAPSTAAAAAAAGYPSRRSTNPGGRTAGQELQRGSGIVVVDPGYEEHVCIRFLLLLPPGFNPAQHVKHVTAGTTGTGSAAGGAGGTAAGRWGGYVRGSDGESPMTITGGRMLLGVDLRQAHARAFAAWQTRRRDAFERRQRDRLMALADERPEEDEMRERKWEKERESEREREREREREMGRERERKAQEQVGKRGTGRAPDTKNTTPGATNAIQKEYRNMMRLQSRGHSSLPTGSFTLSLPNDEDLYAWRVRLSPLVFKDTPFHSELAQIRVSTTATDGVGAAGAGGIAGARGSNEHGVQGSDADTSFSGTGEGAGAAAVASPAQEAGVELEIRFPGGFPFDPPFVRVVSPRFAFHTGHVTVGGSICMELLTQSGWSPAYSLESLLVQLIANMAAGGARVDPRYVRAGRCGCRDGPHAGGCYSLAEAKDAFVRVAGQHGWKV
ncbi:unnamed protein product [Closterium sp. NIES-64]|nr:unnamed protein product [Closterium sp. NIES-64]